MTAKTLPPSGWTGKRFAAVAAVLFAMQAGMIFLFGARWRPTAAHEDPGAHFRAWPRAVSEEDLLRRYFVGDPDVFLTPTRHGFSGGWLDQPQAQYHPTNQLEQPVWLEYTAAVLLHGAAGSQEILPPPETLTEFEAMPEAEPLPVFLPPRVIPKDSMFVLEGPVAERLVGPAPHLQNWRSSQDPPLLANTVVQIAVTPAGEVIAARLLGRSGSPDADGDALATARNLEFRPASQPGEQWAKVIFEWRTAPDSGRK